MPPPPRITSDVALTQTRNLRRLVWGWFRDKNEVDDLVQDAWLVTLLQPEGRVTELEPWLRNVARRRQHTVQRSNRSRIERERRVSASEEVDSGEDDVARRDFLGLVGEVLGAMKEPYRTVLRMRYYDGLDVQEIAKLRGSPTGTVKSQVKRGLDQLRERLEGRTKGRFYGLGVFLRVLGRPRFLAAYGVLGLVGVASVLLAWALSGPGATRVAGAADGERAGGQAQAVTAAFDGARTDRSGAERLAPVVLVEDASAPVATAPGRLVVEVMGEADGRPLDGVRIALRSASARSEREHEETTDANGRARFATLAPGAWTVVPPRGEASLVSVRSDDEARVRLTLPAGVPCVAVARRQGTKVRMPNVRMFLSDPGNPHVEREVGRTDERGFLHLDDVSPDAFLTAVDEDGMRSSAVHIGSARGAVIAVLPAAASHAPVYVHDEAGRPLPGASVSVGATRGLPTRRGVTAPLNWDGPFFVADADELGCVWIPVLTHKATLCQVSADGYLPQSRGVGRWIIGKGLEFRLVRSGASALSGVVLGRDGEPLSGVRLALRSGESLDLECRVRGLQPRFHAQTLTVDDGSFLFHEAPRTAGRLAAFEPGRSEPSLVVPWEPDTGTSRLVLQLPPDVQRATVAGRIALDASVPQRVVVDAAWMERPRDVEVDRFGAFTTPALPLGPYRLGLLQRGRVLDVEAVELGAQGVDGLRLEATYGGIDLLVSTAPGAQLIVGVFRESLYDWHFVGGATTARSARNPFRQDELPPGIYTAKAMAEGFATWRERIEVRPHETVRRELTLPPARLMEVRLRRAEGGAWTGPDQLELHLSGEDGFRTFFEHEILPTSVDDELVLREIIPQGRARIELTTASGYSAEVHVPAGEKPHREVVLLSR